MSESLESLLGNLAQDHVFRQLKFVLNREDLKGPLVHRITTASVGHLTALERRQFAARAAQAREAYMAATGKASAEPDTLVKPIGGGAGSAPGVETKAEKPPAKGFLGVYELMLMQPPEYGNCGEMALLAYRKIIKTAFDCRYSLAIAAVGIADLSPKVAGNHEFVLLGTSPAFFSVLRQQPAELDVSVHAPPHDWGTQVWICDPWIDGGGCRTFRIVDVAGKTGKTLWSSFMAKAAAQASCPVLGEALKDKKGSLKLAVRDCLLINDPALLSGTVVSAPKATPGESKTKA
jgi:hypothetical protein